MTAPAPAPYSASQVTTVQFANLAHHLEEQIRGSTDGGTVNRRPALGGIHRCGQI